MSVCAPLTTSPPLSGVLPDVRPALQASALLLLPQAGLGAEDPMGFFEGGVAAPADPPTAREGGLSFMDCGDISDSHSEGSSNSDSLRSFVDLPALPQA